MADRRRLTIVMTRPTQFDGPLFAELRRNEQLDLRVYYSTPEGKTVARIDPEIGIAPDWNEMATHGYEYETRESGFLGSLRFLRRVVGERPDLIIISGYVPLFHLLIALYAFLWRVPVGLRSDTTLQHSSSAGKSLRTRLKSMAFPVLLKTYSTVHPVGTLATDYLLHYGVSRERVFRFPYAVFNSWFRSESVKHRDHCSALRRTMGIAEGTFVVLGILKFHEREDPLTLVRGFAELRKQCSAPSHLVLVGDGPLRQDIEAAIRLGGLNCVSLPGYAPYRELPMYYSIANAFVHPGIGESWGVSVNESMACGVPVVLSDRIGSHVDLVREGETGFVFKTKDPQSLAECLATLASDRDLCHAMGQKAQALVEDWGYAATEKSLLDAICHVSSETSDRACRSRRVTKQPADRQ